MMKKKSILYMVCLCMLILAVGCGKKNTDKTDKDANTVTPTESVENGDDTTDTEGTDSEDTSSEVKFIENDLVREEYNVNDYIKLGEYKGIKVTPVSTEVTEDDIRVAIQLDLQNAGAELVEVTGRAVQLGDTVNIDYEGLKDGVAFDGGTAQGYDLLIGSKSFIDGFESQLVGVKAGEKVALNLKFPENYGNTDLAGQAVVFNVTVNKIQEFELTEDLAVNTLGFDSLDAYKADVRAHAEEDKIATAEDTIANEVYNKIIANSEITKLPESVVEYFAKDFTVYYTNQAAAYGFDFATFLAMSGITQADFDKEANAYASSMATREVIMKAIAAAEGIELTDEEYMAGVEEYAASYGYESTEAFLENANETLLREDIFYKKVMDFVVAQSVQA